MLQFLLIASSTFASEDLACIGTGLLIAQGRVGLFAGVLACMSGIFFGDLGIFLAGRFAAQWLVRLPQQKLERARTWLADRGPSAILLSRFTPGLRVATYFAAGALKTKVARTTLWLLIASAIWTPLLVGASVYIGGHARWVAFAGVIFLIPRARLHKLTHWEFWPAWAAYIPVAPWILWLSIRHRSLTAFMSANPAIPTGGFVGESKSDILNQLRAAGSRIAAHQLIPEALPLEEKLSRVPDLPIVLKPDVGERGNGVAVIRDRNHLHAYLSAAKGDVIAQEYIAGVEFGIFYIRRTEESHGRVVSITAKHFPQVTGDGKSTLKQLIQNDPRAFCLIDTYKPKDTTPAEGEKVQLVEIGSHCKGAIFLDATNLNTPALERTIDEISQSHPGFQYGRYDVRAESIEALQQGELKVLELNGVSAEPTHIYDPKVTIWQAYKTLYRHWQTAYAIGSANRRKPIPNRFA